MIAVGVDTHKYEHIAVALDGLGQLLGEIAVARDRRGLSGELVCWLAGLGCETVVGIEGTGSYGAGLCQYLETVGVKRRRGRAASAGEIVATGKSDRHRRTLGGQTRACRRRSSRRRERTATRCASPRLCSSPIGRASSERTRLLNQLQGLHVTAPAALRERIGAGNGDRLADRLVRMRDRPDREPARGDRY